MSNNCEYFPRVSHGECSYINGQFPTAATTAFVKKHLALCSSGIVFSPINFLSFDLALNFCENTLKWATIDSNTCYQFLSVYKPKPDPTLFCLSSIHGDLRYGYGHVVADTLDISSPSILHLGVSHEEFALVDCKIGDSRCECGEKCYFKQCFRCFSLSEYNIPTKFYEYDNCVVCDIVDSLHFGCCRWCLVSQPSSFSTDKYVLSSQPLTIKGVKKLLTGAILFDKKLYPHDFSPHQLEKIKPFHTITKSHTSDHAITDIRHRVFYVVPTTSDISRSCLS